MPNREISQLQINGITYDIADATARNNISSQLEFSSGTLTPINSFEAYSDGQNPSWYKWGRIVMLAGAFKAGVPRTGGIDQIPMASLPSEIAPINRIDCVMQGSGAYNWLLTVFPSPSEIAFSRYSGNCEGAAITYSNTSATSWLPIWVTYIAAN